MFLILCSSFVLLIAGVYLQTIPESKANDCPRFDYEYKLLERLLRIEFAQRESDATIEQLHQKLKHLQTDVIQREEIQHLKDNKANGFGSTYVRWGRTTCSGNGTELVYKGFAGGSQYTHTGSSADFLCLTEEPILGRSVAGADPSGYVYGAEYEIYAGSNPFSMVSIQDNMPCCVCKTSRTAILMIPGRKVCYPGWTTEYTGYLMSGYHGHPGATNYVCVDENAEPALGNSGSHDGHLLYVVQAVCGSLPCPPYAEGRLLTCVVCSK
ncbi:hypothetical protein CHS0354_005608 [Potamilus streckersoni]|uniref:Short-chain collagen C4-like n=1 Tax=Potamilus streckersoni TaxID=2493646 RepID=A0AAE0SIT5_9BIVA|nr:hypothetical protein CHS0354_005608 [Potamilus streckersoni]